MNNSELVRLKNQEQAVLELGKRVKDLENKVNPAWLKNALDLSKPNRKKKR